MEDEVVRDIEETFKTLKKINMRLNPKKCTFGVEEGMFLGYQVNTKGIKICPDKVDAVLSLQSPKCLKDVQKLNGKLASLNIGSGSCIQTNEGTYSKVTYAHRSGRIRGTHCLPGSIQGGGERRTNDEKRSYTDANILRQPVAKGLKNKLHRHGKIGAGISTCKPRVSVKGQVLTDFFVERPEEEGQDDSAKEEEPLPARWTLFTDGSSCVDGCGAGVILTDP
ncbi:hypothetical protein Tco_1295998, partial [Tanacetum coccineum]